MALRLIFSEVNAINIMNIDRNLTAKLGHVANITNTISGGMSMNHLDVQANDDHYLVTVKAPGVSVDSFRVSVDDGRLLVHQMLTVEGDIDFPYLINFMEIPFDVNVELISAEYNEHGLEITLPYNEYADGYHRDIEIEH